jgi:hypothetical protein
LIPVWLKQMAGGDYEGGHATASRAAAIGERFGDADLLWLAIDEQGRALIHQGRVEEGLERVDEVLVVAAAGELSPLVTGIVYCNTIAFCQSVYEVRHADAWTSAGPMVRRTAGHGGPQRFVPRSSGGDHAVPRSVGGSSRRGASSCGTVH